MQQLVQQGAASEGEAAAQQQLTDETICTAGQASTEGVCRGDSGGPLLYGDQEPYLLLGALSWGTGPSPCAPGPSHVNAWASLLAPAHRDWLDGGLAALQSSGGSRGAGS